MYTRVPSCKLHKMEQQEKTTPRKQLERTLENPKEIPSIGKKRQGEATRKKDELETSRGRQPSEAEPSWTSFLERASP